MAKIIKTRLSKISELTKHDRLRAGRTKIQTRSTKTQFSGRNQQIERIKTHKHHKTENSQIKLQNDINFT